MIPKKLVLFLAIQSTVSYAGALDTISQIFEPGHKPGRCLAMLVDGSASRDPADKTLFVQTAQQNIAALDDNDRVIIMAIGDTGVGSHIALDKTMVVTGRFVTDKKAKEQLNQTATAAVNQILILQQPQSRIIERLISLRPILQECAAQQRSAHVILMSDMVESSYMSQGGLAKLTASRSSLWQGLNPANGPAATVVVVGAGYPNQSVDEYQHFQIFWTQFFKTAGFQLKTYGKTVATPF